MHERSIVETLLVQVMALTPANAPGSVREVRVRVGPLSGVEPMLMQSAFDQLSTDVIFEHATLAIVEVPLRAQCCLCGMQFNVEDFHFRCASCESNDVVVIDGDAVILESIEIAASALEEPVHGS